MVTRQALIPSARGRAIVDTAYAYPDWATGFISSDDAWFLADCLAAFKPGTIIEIGVASGVSTAFLRRAMESLGLDAGLYSFDILTTYYADPARRVGAFLDQAFHRPPEGFRLFPGVRSTEVPERLSALGVAPADFIFIDADHQHPWPCLDLLGLLPVASSEAWVALHDISLARLHPELAASGPSYLFEAWPGDTCVFALDGRVPNIAAIKLFPSIADSVDAILAVLERAWEVPVEPGFYRPVMRLLDNLGGGRSRRLQAIGRSMMPSSGRVARLMDRGLASLRRRIAAQAARNRRRP